MVVPGIRQLSDESPKIGINVAHKYKQFAAGPPGSRIPQALEYRTARGLARTPAAIAECTDLPLRFTQAYMAMLDKKRKGGFVRHWQTVLDALWVKLEAHQPVTAAGLAQDTELSDKTVAKYLRQYFGNDDWKAAHIRDAYLHYMQQGRHASLREVADYTGYSIGTISKYLKQVESTPPSSAILLFTDHALMALTKEALTGSLPHLKFLFQLTHGISPETLEGMKAEIVFTDDLPDPIDPAPDTAQAPESDTADQEENTDDTGDAAP